jgi:hypothetical protein
MNALILPVVRYLKPMLVYGLTLPCLVSCSGAQGAEGYVPPETLDPPAGTFTRALVTFMQGVQKDHLGTYRRDVRQGLFVDTVKNYLEQKKPYNKSVSDFAPSPADFMCLPNYGYQRVSVRVANAEAIGNAIGALITPSSDASKSSSPSAAANASSVQSTSENVGKLFLALGKDYAIKPEEKTIPASYDVWLANNDGKRCTTSLDGKPDASQPGKAFADPFVTRNYVGREFGPAAAIAAVSMIEAIWSVVKPVITGVLTNIDLERRNKAIQDFFLDDKKVAMLKEDIAETERFLQNEYTFGLQRASGQAVTAAGLLFDSTTPHWKKIDAILHEDKCRNQIEGLANDRTVLAGVTCINTALAAASTQLNQALTTADAFDVALALQLPPAKNPNDPKSKSDRLSDQVDTIRDIALGKQPEEQKLKDLFSALLRYIALAQTGTDAATAANEKKIGDTIDAFKNSLKK